MDEYGIDVSQKNLPNLIYTILTLFLDCGTMLHQLSQTHLPKIKIKPYGWCDTSPVPGLAIQVEQQEGPATRNQ